jgi:hypothetical protein
MKDEADRQRDLETQRAIKCDSQPARPTLTKAGIKDRARQALAGGEAKA